MRFARFVLSVVVLVPALAAAGTTGTHRAPLVVSTLVGNDTAEEMALVTIGGCSGSLIRHDWVLTAAHCVEDAKGNPLPVGSIAVNDGWGSGQARNAIDMHRFRPARDLAIVQVERPFRVKGATHGRSFPADAAVTLDSTHVGRFARIYGRGIFQFAFRDAAGVDQPTQGDNTYRYGSRAISSVDSTGFVTARGATPIAGGDSGGPIYLTGRNGETLGIMGVQSGCALAYLKDHKPPPEGDPPDWNWVSDTHDCHGASVAGVAREIRLRIVQNAPPAPPAAGFARDSVKTTWWNPQLESESGSMLLVDHCLRWASRCGQPAADAFCAMKDPARPLASSNFVRKRGVGGSTVVSDRRECRGPGCVAFTKIVCSAPADPVRARLTQR